MKPLDWKTIPAEALNPRLTRRVIHTGQMTIALLDLKAGAIVPEHAHHNAQVSMVQTGLLKFTVEGTPVLVGPGQVLDLQPNQAHGVEVLEDSVVIDLFIPQREDWIKGEDAYLRG